MSMVMLVVLTACTPASDAGAPPPAEGAATAGGTAPSDGCGEVHADPSIAFESPLAARARMTVGSTGHLSVNGQVGAADITVTGDRASVRLTDREAATSLNCGTVTASVQWIEVAAVRPGTAALSASAMFPPTVTITVVAEGPTSS